MIDQPLTVTSYPWLSYAPLHLAQELHMFDDEGVRVQPRTHARTWLELIDDLDDGYTDLILGNMWFALRRRGPEMVAIAACAQRCRFVLVGPPDHQARPFSWDSLANASVAVASGIPTPWFALRETFDRLRLSLDGARVVSGYSTEEAIRDVSSREVDLALVDIDSAQDERVVEVGALAEALPPIPWSSFFALATVFEQRADELAAFRRAISAAFGWIHAHSPEEVAATLAPRFANLSTEVIAKSVNRYLDLDIWPKTAALDPMEVKSWQQSLLRWGGTTEACELGSVLPLEMATDFEAGE
jgi:ABC-type nitrate/sulfonate/bicarbonate transport system substrate-binding protein